MRWCVLVVLLAGCGGARAQSSTVSIPIVAAKNPFALDQAALATLCAVLRAYAPRSMEWARHGCSADPAPVPSSARPCRVRWHGKADGATSLAYDAQGRLVAVSNKVIAWTYRYDAAGLLLSVTLPEATIQVRHAPNEIHYESAFPTFVHLERFFLEEGRTTRIERGERDSPDYFTYDHGRLVTIKGKLTVSGDELVTRFEWDERGRLRRRRVEQVGAYPRSNESTFEWDPTGRLLSLTDPDATTPIDYQCA